MAVWVPSPNFHFCFILIGYFCITSPTFHMLPPNHGQYLTSDGSVGPLSKLSLLFYPHRVFLYNISNISFLFYVTPQAAFFNNTRNLWGAHFCQMQDLLDEPHGSSNCFWEFRGGWRCKDIPGHHNILGNCRHSCLHIFGHASILIQAIWRTKFLCLGLLTQNLCMRHFWCTVQVPPSTLFAQ